MKKLLLLLLCVPLIGLGQQTYILDDDFEQYLINQGYDIPPTKDYISDLDWEKLNTSNLSSNLITDLPDPCIIQYCSYLDYASLNDYSLYQFNIIWNYAQGTVNSLEEEFDKIKLTFCRKNCNNYDDPIKSFLLDFPDSSYYKESFCYIEYTLKYMQKENENAKHNCNNRVRDYCLDYFDKDKYCVNIICMNHFVKTKYKDNDDSNCYILGSNGIIVEDLNKYYDYNNDGYLDRLITIDDGWENTTVAITKRSPFGLYEFIYFYKMSEKGKIEFSKNLDNIRNDQQETK